MRELSVEPLSHPLVRLFRVCIDIVVDGQEGDFRVVIDVCEELFSIDRVVDDVEVVARIGYNECCLAINGDGG